MVLIPVPHSPAATVHGERGAFYRPGPSGVRLSPKWGCWGPLFPPGSPDSPPLWACASPTPTPAARLERATPSRFHNWIFFFTARFPGPGVPETRPWRVGCRFARVSCRWCSSRLGRNHRAGVVPLGTDAWGTLRQERVSGFGVGLAGAPPRPRHAAWLGPVCQGPPCSGPLQKKRAPGAKLATGSGPAGWVTSADTATSWRLLPCRVRPAGFSPGGGSKTQPWVLSRRCQNVRQKYCVCGGGWRPCPWL